MYSRNTRLSAGIGLAGRQKAVSAVRICWEIVKNRTNCSTEVPRGGHLYGGGGESTNEGVFVLSMRNFLVESTKEGVFVLLNGVLWSESTDKGDFVLSMEVVEIGCAVEWCIAECSLGSNVGRTVTGKYGRRSRTPFCASSL